MSHGGACEVRGLDYRQDDAGRVAGDRGCDGAIIGGDKGTPDAREDGKPTGDGRKGRKMTPEYDKITESARSSFGSAYDRECFDYGFHAGWHGGGSAMAGQSGDAWESGKKNGFRQRANEDK